MELGLSHRVLLLLVISNSSFCNYEFLQNKINQHCTAHFTDKKVPLKTTIKTAALLFKVEQTVEVSQLYSLHVTASYCSSCCVTVQQSCSCGGLALKYGTLPCAQWTLENARTPPPVDDNGSAGAPLSLPVENWS